MERYKYMSVKELAELGVFVYASSSLGHYLRRTEFNKFRKEVGMNKTYYLYCPEFMKTWKQFKERLIRGRKVRHKYGQTGMREVKKNEYKGV